MRTPSIGTFKVPQRVGLNPLCRPLRVQIRETNEVIVETAINAIQFTMSSQRYASGQRYASATTFDVDDARQQLGKFVQTDKNRNETFHVSTYRTLADGRHRRNVKLKLVELLLTSRRPP